MAPELSLKTDTQKSSFPSFSLIFSVADFMYVLYMPSFISSSSDAKIVCLQCSDHVCAMDSSSMSVGSLPSLLKYSLIVFIDSRSKARGPRLVPSLLGMPCFPNLDRFSSSVLRFTVSICISGLSFTSGTL